jgi:hypothetical protein
MSSVEQTLESCARIPLEAWTSGFILFVLSCVGRSLTRGVMTRSRSPTNCLCYVIHSSRRILTGKVPEDRDFSRTHFQWNDSWRAAARSQSKLQGRKTIHKPRNVYCYWPPLWSSCQSSWLQIHSSGFDFRRYQIFWEVVGLERGPLSLVSTIEELLERKSSGFGLENRDYGRWESAALTTQKLALTSPTSGGRSVSIVRLRNQSTEFVCLYYYHSHIHFW